MDFLALAQFILAAMFSLPGLVTFIVSTILKQRWQASIVAVVAASAFMALNSASFSGQGSGTYTIGVVASVIAMMIAAHLAFTIGEKIIRKKSD